MRLSISSAVILLCMAACGGGSTPVPPIMPPPVVSQTLDINGLAAGNGFLRVSGSASTGRSGVPVAGGWDCDGRIDLIVNEMRGNGVSATALDVGNLLIIGGARVPK